MNKPLIFIGLFLHTSLIYSQIGINTDGTAPRAGTLLDIKANQTIAGTDSTVVVTDRGFVGIGTTTPSAKLDVFWSGNDVISGTTGGFRTYTTGGNGLFTGTATSAPYRSWIQSGFTNFATATYDLLLNPNGGNIGIGTTTPSLKLDVNGGLKVGQSSAISNDVNIIDSDVSGYTYYDTDDALWDFKTTATSSAYNQGRFRIWDTEAWGSGEDGGSLLQLYHNGTVDPLCDDCTILDIVETDTDESFLIARNVLLGTPIFNLRANGKLTMSTYGSGTNTGTATYSLAVDASGNVVEEPLGGGGGGGDGWHGSTTRIKILPTDFMTTSNSYPTYHQNNGGNTTGINIAAVALKEIPTGYKAIDAQIYTDDVRTITVYECSIDTNTCVSKGVSSDIQNPSVDFTDVNSTTTNYISIELSSMNGSPRGGYITIAPI